jgi:Ca2+-binding RTX toxin-like protein
MTGMRGRDLLFGQTGNDDLDGSYGADHIWAGSGDDDLNGGLGDDRVLGGRGNDTLDFVGFTHADYGLDYLEGGAGSDTIAARDGVGNDTANCGADEAGRPSTWMTRSSTVNMSTLTSHDVGMLSSTRAKRSVRRRDPDCWTIRA